MRRLLVIHTGDGRRTASVPFLGETLDIELVGCGGDADGARALVANCNGRVAAIALEGLPLILQLGSAVRRDTLGESVAAAAGVPVVDGHIVRDGLERWGVTLAERAQPGLFGGRNVLLLPGVNHAGLVHALARHGRAVRYADRVAFFGGRDLAARGRRGATERRAAAILDRLRRIPIDRLHPASGQRRPVLHPGLFGWADVIAGDIGAIRCYAPDRLDGKTIAVECASDDDLEDLRRRRAFALVTLMPALDGEGTPARWSAAVIEGMLTAIRPAAAVPLTESLCLDLIAGLHWMPVVRYLQPEDEGVNRFAFVIHPLNVSFIHNHPRFWWSRYLPDRLVERVSAYCPPMHVATIRGARSPATGQRVEGHLIALGATPREIMRRRERFTYVRLEKAARMAARKGARIMGLGAFTSVVGDAGVTVARDADIAVTSGNSLTVAATLEAAKQAVLKMGVPDLAAGKAMIVGATGSIGAVCARLLAQAVFDVVLVSIEPERLIDLKQIILGETPRARVSIGTRTEDLIEGCDLVVTATSAFGQRVIDISRCKPGAVVCDVARPPDISEAEARLRPDVLVIEAGEVLIPGDVDFGYDMGLPAKTSYACLAETALLAMEGRFEDYTLGRDIEIGRVKEIYRLFRKHDFKLAGLRSFGRYVTDDDVAARRALADQLRRDPVRFERIRTQAAQRLAALPGASKGIVSTSSSASAPLRRARLRGLVRRAIGAGSVHAFHGVPRSR